MLFLKGRISLKKIKGQVRLIPSTGSLLLQVKRVFPTYEQQTITPDEDEDYLGLSAVIVEPKDRPLIETGATDKISNLILVDVHFPGGMVEDITPPETLTGAKCYYNGVLLPGIPAEILTEYPYIWIRQNTTSGDYQLVFGKAPWYYKAGMNCGNSVANPYYSIPISTYANATEWSSMKISSGTFFTIDSTRTVLWSNHDIPNGSADATDIYFEGSEPVPAE